MSTRRILLTAPELNEANQIFVTLLQNILTEAQQVVNDSCVLANQLRLVDGIK